MPCFATFSALKRARCLLQPAVHFESRWLSLEYGSTELLRVFSNHRKSSFRLNDFYRQLAALRGCFRELRQKVQRLHGCHGGVPLRASSNGCRLCPRRRHARAAAGLVQAAGAPQSVRLPVRRLVGMLTRRLPRPARITRTSTFRCSREFTCTRMQTYLLKFQIWQTIRQHLTKLYSKFDKKYVSSGKC